MEYNFVVVGNPIDKKGNPIGYTRVTYQGKYSPQSMRYQNWKNYVITEFWRQISGREKLVRPFNHPRGKMFVKIFFVDERHPDPDNTAKGILDALCNNDKEMDIETTHYCRQPLGRVEIKLLIDNDNE